MPKGKASSSRRQGARRIQTRDRAATQKALIAAGEKLFAKCGFDGATIDMLTDEAGVNKALVSYYFGSKEGLYDAVIADFAGDIVARVKEGVTSTSDPVRNFRSYILSLAREFAGRRTFLAILMREFISGSVQERAGPFQDLLQFYKMTEDLYKDGFRKNVFRRQDSHMLHISIIGPLVHFVLTARLRERTTGKRMLDLTNPSIEEFAGHLAKLILDGMRRTD